MKFQLTEIPDVIIITPEIYRDARGHFLETYHEGEYTAAGIGPKFVQDNHSRSRKGVLRGMHYQIQNAQGKLIRVASGKIYDVAVDLRRASNTYQEYVGVTLDDQKREQLWIPPGFAHGFYVLSDWAEVSYKVTNYYSPKDERTLAWDDPTVNIQWPLLENALPLLSNNDAEGSIFPNIEVYG